jgi:hypothetical protein
MTSQIEINDESGLLQGVPPIPDVQQQFSSMRNVKLHTPYTVCRRSLNLNKWLG